MGKKLCLSKKGFIQIIFAPEMVRATLDGHKTQTRQVFKPQPKWAIQNEGDKPEIFKNMYGQVDAVWYSPTYYPVNDGADFDFDWDAEWVKCPYAPRRHPLGAGNVGGDRNAR